ncbi:MAG: hypothetical protein LQ342_003157 [Letrouitia transgressa]|nr:MAG: hypothetical protein LQ342_003157 [Letrouitia transgressa]
MARFSYPSYSNHPPFRAQPSFPSSHTRRRRYVLSTLLFLFLGYLYLKPPSSLSIFPSPSSSRKPIDQSRYAYILPVTSTAYLCNAVMLFESLSRLGSRADRVLIYPQEWDTEISDPADRDSQLLVKARSWYGVKIVPADIAIMRDRFHGDEEDEEDDEEAWSNELKAKFMAWGQTDYDRIIILDSDVLMRRHLDELFQLPKTQVAMIRAYWELPKKRILSPLLLVVEPSQAEYQRLTATTRADYGQRGESETDILNRFYGDSAMVLPHQQYGLSSGEFRLHDHRSFLGNMYDGWDPEKVIDDASLVYFLDSPFPKPWIMWPPSLLAEKRPKCDGEDCRDRDIWMGLYDDFRQRRKDICALLSAPAPEWPPSGHGNLTASRY